MTAKWPENVKHDPAPHDREVREKYGDLPALICGRAENYGEITICSEEVDLVVRDLLKGDLMSAFERIEQASTHEPASWSLPEGEG